MRITRLYLRGYRVFGDELDLPMPAGLVGIYGVNGAGKSALVESIRWTLFGKARTPKDEVRTSDIKSDCVTEVEFEHEGHLYLVRRTLTGQNATPKAEAHWNGQQVAEGVTDVRRYVESVLGMDDTAFRASVFAEQKQVSAFSDVSPDKRRELVLRLLGITPLERARDLARADARDNKKLHDNLQQKLPDLDELRGLLALAEDACTARQAEATVANEALADAVAARDAADVTFEAADALRSDYERMVNEGKATVALLKETTERRAQLEAEQEALADAATRIEVLRPLVDGLGERELRLAGLRAVHAAEQAVAKLPTGDAPPEPDEAPLDAARAAADAAGAEAADLQGALRGARAELERAEASAARSDTLSAEEDCPVCGQSLGEAFEQVQAHRHAEVRDAAERAATLEQQLAAATTSAATARTKVEAAQKALRTAQQAWGAWQEQSGRRAAAEAALADALASLPGGKPKKGELHRLTDEVTAGKDAAVELQRLEGRLDRREAVDAELVSLIARIDDLAAAADALRVQVKELGFKPEALADAKAAREKARAAADARTKEVADTQASAIKAAAAVDAAKERLTQGEASHAELASLVEEVRHTARAAELLSEFRNTVVQAIGPQLAMQAADLFAELTDHEYEQLDVDPETFEIRIRDAGIEHGLARFSGSETDLANLALRIAISEHVRFQSGGAVGLLVLDEVFGPLDPDRKERMLQALNRLGSRFRQVLVITHDAEIKEQLPSAIEVVKLPGRRATARVLSGV